ncbi:CAP domain-containing protein [Streptomyces chattanoogensis]|uniref:CAP domain-containing protein n=1 Tax=Streptomyces chattanoogensis TaxID=66876 RepID=UPI00062CBF4E
MTKHRRKTHHRKIIIAAVAIGAVGVPSVAMACFDGSQEYWGRHHRHGGASYHHWRTGAHHRGPASTTHAPQTPTASPSASKSAAPASGASARVVELVNNERSKAGCAPLVVNAKLTKAAQAHSKDMADHRNMSHTGSDGSSPGDRITRAGYDWSAYGENVAYGYATPESVMKGWMSSPGHKRNILDCSFKEIGVGLAQPGNYWTQDFGAAR